MKYQIKYEKNCLKYLIRLPKNTRIRIISAINQLPFGDVKRLQGIPDSYRLRVGDYRIIFCKNDEQLIISILEIASRGEVYKRI